MATFSELTLVGYLGSSAEQKTIISEKTGEELTLTKFSVAVNHRKGDSTEKVQWYVCEIWRNNDKIETNWFEKGKQVFVKGNLQIEEYQNSEGNERISFKVNVQKFLFLGKKE